MRKSVAAILSAALIATPLAAAQDGAPRAPTGKWNVDFGNSQCVAVLSYGDPDDPETLLIKPIPTGKHVQIAMVVDGGKRAALERTGEIRINGTVRDAQLLHYGTSQKKEVYRFMVPGTIDAFKDLRRIEMQLPRRDQYDLEVPSMPKVAKALDDCLTNLRTYWNVDNAALASGPVGDVTGLFSSSDYPAQALRERESGIANAFLLVDEEGKVADCTLSAFAGNIILAAQTCAILTERAKFEPARDADGNAVRGAVAAPSVRWFVDNAKTSMSDLQAQVDRLTDAAGDCIEFGGTC